MVLFLVCPVKMHCAYMEEHFEENITLDELISMTSFGKSYLLRSFTKQVGFAILLSADSTAGQGQKVSVTGNCAGSCGKSGRICGPEPFSNFFKEFTDRNRTHNIRRIPHTIRTAIFSYRVSVGCVDAKNDKCVMVIDEGLAEGYSCWFISDILKRWDFMDTL